MIFIYLENDNERDPDSYGYFYADINGADLAKYVCKCN